MSGFLFLKSQIPDEKKSGIPSNISIVTWKINGIGKYCFTDAVVNHGGSCMKSLFLFWHFSKCSNQDVTGQSYHTISMKNSVNHVQWVHLWTKGLNLFLQFSSYSLTFSLHFQPQHCNSPSEQALPRVSFNVKQWERIRKWQSTTLEIILSFFGSSSGRWSIGISQGIDHKEATWRIQFQ